MPQPGPSSASAPSSSSVPLSHLSQPLLSMPGVGSQLPPLPLSPLVPVGALDACPFPFLELPIPLQHSILDLCDPHTLGHLSQCCTKLRELACEEVTVLTVPASCCGDDLAAAPLARFPRARRLVLSGRYPTLFSPHLDAFLSTLSPRPSTPSTPLGGPGPGSHLADRPHLCDGRSNGGEDAAPHTAPTPTLRSHFPHLSELCLWRLRLTQPLPLSVAQSLPEVWPGLRRLELVGVRFNCPLSCSKREALEPVIGSYCNEHDGIRRLPSMFVVWAVDVHEQRVDRNILVSLELCRAAGRLRCLEHFALRGHDLLHLHDSAIRQLYSCTRLQSLALDLPADWPHVTGRSVSALPRSLQTLTLGSLNPDADARLLPHTCAAVTLEVSPRPPPRYRPSPSQQLLDGYLQSSYGARQPLPTLGNLSTLSWQSGVPDPGPEDPEAEGHVAVTRGQQADAGREAQEKEGKALALLLAASPQLHHLRVDGVGQALLASLLKSVEAAPSHTLDVSLHHGVNPLPLLYSPLRASVGLTLQAISPADLRTLCSSHGPGTPNSNLKFEPGTRKSKTATAVPDVVGVGKGGRQLAAVVAPLPAAAVVASKGLGAAKGAATAAAAPKAAAGAKLSKKERKAAEAAAAAELKRLQLEQQRLEQEQRKAAQRAAAAAAAAAGKWSVPLGPRLGVLRRLHLQHCPDITDESVAEAVSLCPTLVVLQLTSCRNITCQVVKEVAKLKRAIKLGCAMCREVTPDGWRAAAAEARHLPGAVVRDIVLPRPDPHEGQAAQGGQAGQGVMGGQGAMGVQGEEGVCWVELGP